MDKNNRGRIHLARYIVLFFAIYLSFLPALLKNNSAEVFAASKAYNANVHFIDVGQGDCILIELPDKKTMLIDAGPTSSSQKVVAYIDKLNISTIDYLILTHSDEDHSGGMTAILQNFEVKHIFRPFIAANNSTVLEDYDELFLLYDNTEICVVDTIAYANFIKHAYDEVYTQDGIEYQSDITVNYDGYVIYSHDDAFPYFIEFHHPPKASESIIPSIRTQGFATKYYGSDTNSYSAIISFEYEDEKFLFTGDATKTAENDFLKNLPKPSQSDYERSSAVKNISLLKVAHHGSGSSTNANFLEVVNPQYAVICCGASNSYNHPHPSTLDRLNKLWDAFDTSPRIFRTDINGNIVASTNGSGIEFFIENEFPVETLKPNHDRGWVVYVIITVVVLVLSASVFIRFYKIRQERLKEQHSSNMDSEKEIKKKVKTLLSKPNQRKKQ